MTVFVRGTFYVLRIHRRIFYSFIDIIIAYRHWALCLAVGNH